MSEKNDPPQSSDIRGGQPSWWLVVGWFTEDSVYRPLAEKFAARLDECGAPYHLWSKPKVKGMSRLDTILMKPAVVLEAMAAYPGKTVVLMDIDCVLRGDLTPLVDVDGDVGIALFGGMPTKDKDWRVWLGLSTRVMVFKPTGPARIFAERWAALVKTEGGHEERCAAMAFLSSTVDVRFHHIDIAYSGRETHQLPNGIVLHESVSSTLKAAVRHPFMQMLRNFERRFLRSGRSGRQKSATIAIMRPVGAAEGVRQRQ